MRRAAIFFLMILWGATFAAAQTAEDKKLDAFLDEEWEYQLKENPVYASLLGDLRYNDQLGDYSFAAIQKSQSHDRDAMQRLQAISRDALSKDEQLNYDLYMDNLRLSIQGQQFPGYLMPINQRGGIQVDLPNMSPSLQFRTVKDYEDYISRLKQVPVVMDQTLELLKMGLEKNITPPRVTLRDVADQIQAQVVPSADKSPFYDPFKKFPEGMSFRDQQRLKTQGEMAILNSVVPAYQKLLDYWTRTYYPKTREAIALSALPNGADWYAYLAKYYTTTDLTPQQIHEIGLSEVARIRAEMDELIKQIGFKGTFDDFTNFLRTDPQFFYTKPEDLVSGYRDICKRIDAELPKLFGTLPRTPYGVHEIPMYSAPSATTAYYEEGSMAAGRAGYYAVNTYRLDMRPKWEMEALSMHESVPGHHLQISIGQELQNIPKFRRFAGYTAFVEGWALYSESLGTEMGFYKDPYSKFGQLTYEMWRAVRLVVDTGMHVLGWDRQKAIDYFKANTSKTEQDIVVEIDRYITSPGQALAYKIGELKIKELRKYATDQLGSSFDIREFHDHVLGNGAVPLSVLEAQIHDYVAAKKQGATAK